MQYQKRWWEQRWLPVSLGLIGGLITLVSSCNGYERASERAERVGDVLENATFSPQGETIYGIVSHDLLDEESTKLVAWRASGKRLWQTPLFAKHGQHDTSSGDVSRFYLRRDLLLIVFYDQQFVVERPTGKLLWTRRSPLGQPVDEEPQAGFSPAGDLCYIHANGEIRVYEARTGRQRAVLWDHGTDCLAVCADGKLILREERDERSVLTVVDPQTQKTQRALARDLHYWALSPDGKQVVGISGLTLFVEDTHTGKRGAKTTLPYPGRLSYFPDGQRIFLHGPQWIWNPAQNVLRPANPSEKPVEESRTWSFPDSRRTVVANQEGRRGHRVSLATIQDSRTKKPLCSLEGTTGW